MAPVKNQGQCDSHQAFSTTSSLDSTWETARGLCDGRFWLKR